MIWYNASGIGASRHSDGRTAGEVSSRRANKRTALLSRRDGNGVMLRTIAVRHCCSKWTLTAQIIMNGYCFAKPKRTEFRWQFRADLLREHSSQCPPGPWREQDAVARKPAGIDESGIRRFFPENRQPVRRNRAHASPMVDHPRGSQPRRECGCRAEQEFPALQRGCRI